jgi:sulfide:quinone oxidoreductase
MPQAGVFAIGDCTVSPLPGKFKPDASLVLPKAGVFADRQGIVVAQNIALAMRGQTSRVSYDGKGSCYIETGDMHAARGDGSFFELPHPTMERHIPDMTLYDGKREWIKGLIERFLGS